MITVLGNPRRTCDGLTRREALTAGALPLLGGLSNLPALRALESSGRTRRAKAKSVLFLYLQGGPATQDMWDLKPAAPAGIRGEFKPVRSNVPGLDVCEHLPRMAKWMHKAVVIRSVHHKGGCHNNLPMYTGHDVPPPDDSPRPTDPPSMGSVMQYHEQEILRRKPGPLPAYVYLPCPLGWGEARNKPGPWAGFLGQRYDPLHTECTAYLDRPMKKSDDMQVVRGEPLFRNLALPPGVTLDRLKGRVGLREQLDAKMRGLEAHAKKERLAYDLLTSATVREAFDFESEPARLRDRYGGSLFGTSVLLARRLLERGVRFVNVSWDNFRERFEYQPCHFVWDTHERNFSILRHNHLPSFDRTYSALMEDLDSRGMLDETLVVVMGEMGRTPKINKEAGRDHWTHCYSVLLAGGGIRGGQAYGASDAHAAYVKDRPVHIRDICATVYRCLGIDPDMAVPDHNGKPVPVAHGGKALDDILA
ncbi:MAG: DUF1501 domain-containing protein [Gemmataceae bacterium]|nr:DUF1501 domain-containing protein [Gemmataceae bacterium]